MSEPRDIADVRDERRALLELTAGRHQRRYARTRTLQRRARELTAELLRAEAATKRTETIEPAHQASEVNHDEDASERDRRDLFWWQRD
jgi:hypothetical protein